MNQENKFEQEIDVRYLGQSIQTFFRAIGIKVYQFLMFVKRYFFILLSLLVIGSVLGYYLDKYLPDDVENSVLVAPNFGSVDYLYQSVKNRSFLGKLDKEEIKLAKSIEEIEIEPIDDLYNMIQNNQSSLEVFSILSNKGSDIDKITSNYLTSKNYRYHQINFITKGDANVAAIADMIVSKLNSNRAYFEERSVIEIENLNLKKEEYIKTLNQLNAVLDRLGTSSAIEMHKELSINDYSSSVDLIAAKYRVLDEIKNINVLLEESSRTIFEIDRVLYKARPMLFAPYVIVFPCVLIFGFLISFGVIQFIKRFKTIVEAA